MKKSINGKKHSNNKLIIIFTIVFLFTMFISSCFILFDRDYFLGEKLLKSLSSSINSFFINNSYSKDSFNKNILSSKVIYLEQENNKLKETLELKKTNTDLIVSNVINHNANFWYKKIDINKGYSDNIKKDDAVINSKGLVGFISKTAKNVSEVKLLTGVSENSMISVTIDINGKEVAGVLTKYNPSKNVFIVKDVMYKDEILAGSKVTLSGFNNDSYKGIYIGSVVKERVSNFGLTKEIEVESSVNFDDLLFVAVVGEKK